jgi:hypothetical protein
VLATGRWFSPGTPVSSANKTDRHDITLILLKVALNTINQTKSNTCNEKDWVVRNQDNVVEWCDMSICKTVVSMSKHYKNPTMHVILVQSRSHHLIEN